MFFLHYGTHKIGLPQGEGRAHPRVPSAYPTRTPSVPPAYPPKTCAGIQKTDPNPKSTFEYQVNFWNPAQKFDPKFPRTRALAFAGLYYYIPANAEKTGTQLFPYLSLWVREVGTRGYAAGTRTHRVPAKF